MSAFEVFYVVDGRQIARESPGDLPARGDEVFIEQTTGLIPGGLFEVIKVRRVLGETATSASITRAESGGAIDVVPRSAYVTLKPAETRGKN